MSSFREHRRCSRSGVATGTPVWFVQGFGFGLIVVGALIDVAYHLWWSDDDSRAVFGLVGHLVTLVGMVLTMVAVAAVGLRSVGRPPGKGEIDARRSTSAS